MFDCKDVTERASDYLDDALSRRERAGLRLHLLVCEYCRRYMRQMRAIVGALHRLDEAPAEAPDTRRRLGGINPTATLIGRLGLAALATALLVGVWFAPGPAPLQEAVYEHAIDGHARPGTPLPDAAVQTVLTRFGVQLRAGSGRWVYAHLCDLGGLDVAHLMLDAPSGAVTVLLIPDREQAPEAFHRGALYGVLAPHPAGTLALLGPDQAEVADLARRLPEMLAGATAGGLASPLSLASASAPER